MPSPTTSLVQWHDAQSKKQSVAYKPDNQLRKPAFAQWPPQLTEFAIAQFVRAQNKVAAKLGVLTIPCCRMAVLSECTMAAEVFPKSISNPSGCD